MAKPTNGPWHIQEGNGFDNRPATLISSLSGYLVASTGFVTKESQANARLIAAAPELLEALIGMVEMFKDAPTLEQFAYDEPPEPRSQWGYDAILMIGDARSVITKATGDTP